MPRVSHINLNYEAIENQFKATQNVLTTKQEDHSDTRVVGYLQHTYASVYGGKE
jgi:hypothetical protein